ncbi:hypothetical protein BDV96DRAFT_391880 [Lophiotrema nucula]|uniref:Uncharacterized protein n=1 Tax=Lophiotrema nucula TaxID=690887 RepID=A0A6A5ZK31_9PLEO|nr:hypothetical protein BDV96DRAFT_391880 [Lophiotrema nucula]
MAAPTTAVTVEGYDGEGVPGVNALQIQQRYGEERAKRLRDDGNDQFVDISLHPKYASFLEDPWVDPTRIKDARTQFLNDRAGMIVLGAGWGGLLYAIRQVQAGMKPEDIRIVDSAGGFGGTWYWNRYPGLTCDIESYCYLPLLEETGYIPKHRYSYGEEIREYAELCTRKWGLEDSGVFQTKAEKLVWDEEAKEWVVMLVQKRKKEQEEKRLSVRSPFVATVNGVLNWPKLPGIPGVLDFKGDVFHSARWDYTVTGGSPMEPSLTKLEGKRVAIVGSGVTAVQIVPQVARWAKHLYVIQRTPSGVDERGQRETDSEWFKKEVAVGAGWQRERLSNLHQHFTTGELPAVNLVGDGWTHAPGMAAAAGNADGPRSMEELPDYIKRLHALDMPRQDRVRRRVEQIVKDASVAKKLQAWYPTWCKRPAFHDEYLGTFNRDNVTLVDTDGKGLGSLTDDSIVAGDQSYPVDVIIFATGYRAPFLGTPAEKANMAILGRAGVSMSEQWSRNGPQTQHGLLDANFPNLFLSGPWQAALSPSNLFNLDALARLAAYVVAEAKRKSGGGAFAVTITGEAAESWGNQILMNSAPMSAVAGCTPSYFNVEGGLDRLPPEIMPTVVRSGLWGRGIEDFVRVVEEWKSEGSMQGIEVIT